MKALFPQIDLSTWTKVGEGGNGSTYINPSQPDMILKVNNDRLSNFEFVKHEFEVSKAVESLGLPTPKMHEMVRVGNSYATISQLIKDKRSLSRICHDEPQRIEEIALLFTEKAKELFATPCNTDFFPNRKEQAMKGLETASFVSKKNRKIIRPFIESIPESDNCVHGDFQPGNLIQADGQCYWIDLDRFAHGDAMFDIGHLFQICQIYAPMKRVQEIFHMTLDQFHTFWDIFAKAYTGKDDHTEFDSLAGKYACIDIILRSVFMTPTILESLFFRMHVNRLVKQYYK